MKIFLFTVLCACAYAHAAVFIHNENLDSVQSQLDRRQITLKSSSVYDESDELPPYVIKAISISHGQRNVVVNSIESVLESFRDVIINGNDNLPPLGPLEIYHLGPFVYRVVGFRTTVNIYNLNVDGLQWYVVDEVTFDALRLRITTRVTIPRLTITGSYDANARLALFITHSAGGNFRVFINRIEVNVNLRLGTSLVGGHLTLRELDVHIDIHDTHIRIDGMIGSGLINNFINLMIQNFSQDLVQTQMDNVSQSISAALFDIVDEIVRGFTINDLLGL